MLWFQGKSIFEVGTTRQKSLLPLTGYRTTDKSPISYAWVPHWKVEMFILALHGFHEDSTQSLTHSRHSFKSMTLLTGGSHMLTVGLMAQGGWSCDSQSRAPSWASQCLHAMLCCTSTLSDYSIWQGSSQEAWRQEWSHAGEDTVPFILWEVSLYRLIDSSIHLFIQQAVWSTFNTWIKLDIGGVTVLW